MCGELRWQKILFLGCGRGEVSVLGMGWRGGGFGIVGLWGWFVVGGDFCGGGCFGSVGAVFRRLVRLFVHALHT